MSTKVSEVNPDILKKCRLQLGFSLSEVEAKVKQIREVENGSHTPTLKQLDTLAKLYTVPRWVFISPDLPTEFDFSNSVSAFRYFSQKSPDIFSNVKVRAVTSRVSKLRDLLLELLEDLDEGNEPFSPPYMEPLDTVEDVATKVRSWLSVGNDSHTFLEWKDILETKGLFIFMTSKYLGWSHIEEENLRGFSIYLDVRPMILINGTDWKKAQSFTLFHELAHILRKESSLDSWEASTRSEEKWCDDFAGALLVPSRLINRSASSLTDLSEIKNEAKKFNVSVYAYIVRIRRLDLISQKLYLRLEEKIRKEFLDERSRIEKTEAKISRNRSSEIIQQYGRLLTSTLYQAYDNKILDLQKLIKILDVKNVNTVFKIGSLL